MPPGPEKICDGCHCSFDAWEHHIKSKWESTPRVAVKIFKEYRDQYDSLVELTAFAALMAWFSLSEGFAICPHCKALVRTQGGRVAVG